MMKPEPSELVLRGGWDSLRSPLGEPPRRFLKKSSKNSSNGEPGGNCGTASRPPPPPLASTLCDVEMLTTESMTFSAISAMPSGPRAMAGAVAIRPAAVSEIAIPIRRRRRLKAGLAPVMSGRLQRVGFISTVRPNGSEAQASAPDIPAKNRPRAPHDCVDGTATCASCRDLRRSEGAPPEDRPLKLPPHGPDQHQTQHRRDDADDPQKVVRRRQRAFHGPAHPGRAGCEHQA